MSKPTSIEEKVELLKRAQEAYQAGSPIMTDDEYDKLVHETSSLDKLPIGIRDGEVKHPSKMYSLQDIFNPEDLGKWMVKVKSQQGNIKMYPEMKYDGVSLNLIYKNGKLIQAITRGDGEKGRDVTQLAMNAIRYIPQTIHITGEIEIRGEVCISFENFERINELRTIDGKEQYANPRNLTAGSMGLNDIEVVKTRHLDFIAWGMITSPMQKHTDILSKLKHNGFQTSLIVLKDVKSLQIMYDDGIEKRRDSKYPLDGIVVKVDDVHASEALGYNSKFPLHMVALKFPPIEKSTTLINIRWQVGSTGILTPVADLMPVQIDGSNVSKVTLHNKAHIERLDIMINDEVIIIKSGDIIPKLIGVLKDKRKDGRDSQSVIYPEKCIHCDGKIIEDDTNLMCINPTCPMMMNKTIERFVNKKHFNIKHLSTAIIEKLQTQLVIETPLDLLRLEEKNLKPHMKSLRMAKKSMDRLLDGIKNCKTIELKRFISALGIHGVGTTFGALIEDNFKVTDGKELFDITEEQLFAIHGIGGEGAKTFTEYFKRYPDYINGLLEEITLINKEPTLQHRYSGRTVGISGSFEISRGEMKKRLEKYGIKLTGISKTNDFYIVGKAASMDKIDKIRQYSHEIQFKALMEGVD